MECRKWLVVVSMAQMQFFMCGCIWSSCRSLAAMLNMKSFLKCFVKGQTHASAQPGPWGPPRLFSSISAGFWAGISHSYLCPQRHNGVSPGLLPGAPVSQAAATQRETAFCSDLDFSSVVLWLHLRTSICASHTCCLLNREANVLYLEGCLSCCLVQSVIAKHNMLAMPSPKPSG